MTDQPPPPVPFAQYKRIVEAVQRITRAAVSARELLTAPANVEDAITDLEYARQVYDDLKIGELPELPDEYVAFVTGDNKLHVLSTEDDPEPNHVTDEEIEAWFGMTFVDRVISQNRPVIEFNLRLMSEAGWVYITKCAIHQHKGIDLRAFFQAWGKQVRERAPGLFRFGTPPEKPIWYSLDFDDIHFKSGVFPD